MYKLICETRKSFFASAFVISLIPRHFNFKFAIFKVHRQVKPSQSNTHTGWYFDVPGFRELLHSCAAPSPTGTASSISITRSTFRRTQRTSEPRRH